MSETNPAAMVLPGGCALLQQAAFCRSQEALRGEPVCWTGAGWLTGMTQKANRPSTSLLPSSCMSISTHIDATCSQTVTDRRCPNSGCPKCAKKSPGYTRQPTLTASNYPVMDHKRQILILTKSLLEATNRVTGFVAIAPSADPIGQRSAARACTRVHGISK